MLVSNSCKGKEDTTTTGLKSGSADSLKMYNLILDTNTMKKWVDSNWTVPSNPNSLKVLLLQFYSEDASRLGDSMNLVCYPAKKAQSAGARGQYFLKMETTTAPTSFTGKVLFANNVLDLAAMNLFTNSGALNNVAYVRFKPKIGAGNFLVFETEIVKLDMAAVAGPITNPCPPCQYCNPPNCNEESFE